jgi:hypothetical protein
MPDRTETYCSAVNEVVCGFCPLALVTEAEWGGAVEPGTTPYMLGREVDDALSDATLASQGRSQPVPEIPKQVADELQYETKGYDPDEQDAEYGLETLRRGSFTLPWDELTRSNVGIQFSHCVHTIIRGECEVRPISEEEELGSSPLAGIIDNQTGAEMLGNIARHGSANDVAEMVRRILAWGQSYGAELDAELDLEGEDAELTGRAFLMVFADRLANRTGSDQPD